MSSPDLIRVVLADDHAVVRAGLKAVLGAAPDIAVVGEAKDGREAVSLAERLKPDIVVMDLSMGEVDGTTATKEIVAKELPTKVLVLTMHAEEEYLVPVLEAGAAGYLVKSAADRDLVDAVRAGLKAVLGAAPDITVIGEAKDGREAVSLAERLKPDVVVMDLSMGEVDGATATKEIVAKELPTKVLVLTMHAEEEYLVPVLEAGAAGYLVKSAADRDLVDAVRAVARGDMYVRASAARVLAKNLTKKDPVKAERERFEKLTERERDVLRLTAQGFSAPEIGERLFISPKTVDTYKQRIQEKLGLSHRSDYVQMALRLGLLAES